jgi:copper transport protein
VTKRRFLRLPLALAAFVAVLHAGTGVAAAHANLVATNPGDGSSVATSPVEVDATFSESISIDLGGLSVRDTDGTRVDDGASRVDATGRTVATRLRPDLPDGTYVATYRVLSADGHPVSGSFLFGIGTDVIDASAGRGGTSSDRAWEVAGAVARFLMYLGALLAAGLAFFLAFLHDQLTDRWKLVPVVRVAAVLGLLGSVGVIVVQAALLTGRGLGSVAESGVLKSVLGERLGWSIVVLLLGLATVHLSTNTNRLFVARGLALVGGLAVTVSFSLWGHAIEAPSTWIAVGANVVHTTAAALWFGGLVGLAMVLRRRSPRPVASTARILGRFSEMAAITVGALFVAGITMAWIETGGSMSGLTGTTYGRLVLAKITVTLGVVAIAAFNRYRLVPSLTAPVAADIEPGDNDGADPMLWARLTRTVRFEALALIAVLAFTSVLVSVTPARTEQALAPVTVSLSQPMTTGSVALAVSPALAGVNTMVIQYTGADGQPVDVANSITVEFSLPSAQLGPITRQVIKSGPGRFVLEGPELSLRGAWDVTLKVRTGDFTQEQSGFQIPIR